MFDLIKNIINYPTGTGYTNIDSYVIYICGAIIILLTCIFIDLIFKVFRAFIPRSWR